MMIKKVDFKSRNNKPIMTAYLGADFDQRQAFKEMDQNKVSIKRRRKVYQKIDVIFRLDMSPGMC